MLEAFFRQGLVVAARVLTGVRGIWAASGVPKTPCLIYANHVSHGDFVLIWAVLPVALRERARPVAGKDYWGKGALKRYVGERVVRGVLIEREAAKRTEDPIAQMGAVLSAGDSLILFPEGTRNLTEETLLRFKSGLYHLAAANPEVPVIPAWIDNLHRVLPKGEVIPIPLLCTVTFGDPLAPIAEESKEAYLERARAALLALRPAHVGDHP
jgi:1-acyl-sn-glycerol-3-phosphate acyltransferase